MSSTRFPPSSPFSPVCPLAYLTQSVGPLQYTRKNGGGQGTGGRRDRDRDKEGERRRDDNKPLRGGGKRREDVEPGYAQEEYKPRLLLV